MQVTRVRVRRSSRGFQLFADYRLNTGKRARLFEGNYTNRADLNKAIMDISAGNRPGRVLAGTDGV